MNIGHLTVKELPAPERPYEKFLKSGAYALTDAELLAILLKTGTKGETSVELARKILQLPDGRQSLLALHQKPLEELKKLSGVGTVKAITLKCVAELSRRISMAAMPEKMIVDSPRLLADYYMESLRHLTYEQTRIAFLNGASGFMGDFLLSSGTVNQSLVSTREIFIKALNSGAVYIIMIHNHPSGNPTPSKEDIFITKKIKEAGSIMDIQLIDHIIIGDNCYISLKESGLF
ncbi:MAG: DNA repair protein RadC [Lachnospiraceae bacterium]